jgi:hypothetical protein
VKSRNLHQAAPVDVSLPRSQQKQQRRKFCMEDLPEGSQWRFRLELTPLWIDFIATLEGLWDASDHVDVVQEQWDIVFTEIEHTVAKKNDPVYALVCPASFSFFFVLSY